MSWITRILEQMDREFADFNGQIDQIFSNTRQNSGRLLVSGPHVYGFSLKIGPDGKPVFREWGNGGQSISGPQTDGEREPYVDVVNDEKENVLKVTAEMPGLEKNDIRADIEERSISLSAEHGDKRYRKEVELPVAVDPRSSKASYVNGVLELSLKVKQPKPKPKGFSVKIE